MADSGNEAGRLGKLTVTRLEVIDHRAAAGDKHRHVIVPASDAQCDVEIHTQDEGRTLKIFIKDA